MVITYGPAPKRRINAIFSCLHTKRCSVLACCALQYTPGNFPNAMRLLQQSGVLALSCALSVTTLFHRLTLRVRESQTPLFLRMQLYAALASRGFPLGVFNGKSGKSSEYIGVKCASHRKVQSCVNISFTGSTERLAIY